MIAPPKTYADWAALLRTFERGTADEDVLHALRTGTLAWQSGVAERFARRFSHAINARINAASDRFDRDMQHASDERGTISALLSLRRSLSFLHAAADLPTLPAEQRASFAGLVQHAADHMQESLENSAKSDRSGKMSDVVRSHRVNVFEDHLLFKAEERL